MKKLLAITQACAILKIHPDTLKRWADNGDIACIRDSARRRLFWENDVLDAQARMNPAGTDKRPKPEA